MALALAVASCAPQMNDAGDDGGGGESAGLSPDEIVRGRLDRARDPGVVALRVGNDALCSGTLVAPRAVLTARHCVSRLASERVDCASRARQLVGEIDARTITVVTSVDALDAEPVARGVRTIVPAGDRLCGADIAVVVLDRAITGITPVPVELTRAPRVGDTVTAVGYGLQADGRTVGERERRAGIPIVDVTSSEFAVGEAICQGDSGGPALATATGAVLGVVSRGGPTCTGLRTTNIYTRVDAWADLVREGLRQGAAPR